MHLLAALGYPLDYVAAVVIVCLRGGEVKMLRFSVELPYDDRCNISKRVWLNRFKGKVSKYKHFEVLNYPKKIKLYFDKTDF